METNWHDKQGQRYEEYPQQRLCRTQIAIERLPKCHQDILSLFRRRSAARVHCGRLKRTTDGSLERPLRHVSSRVALLVGVHVGVVFPYHPKRTLRQSISAWCSTQQKHSHRCTVSFENGKSEDRPQAKHKTHSLLSFISTQCEPESEPLWEFRTWRCGMSMLEPSCLLAQTELNSPELGKALNFFTSIYSFGPLTDPSLLPCFLWHLT